MQSASVNYPQSAVRAREIRVLSNHFRSFPVYFPLFSRALDAHVTYAPGRLINRVALSLPSALLPEDFNVASASGPKMSGSVWSCSIYGGCHCVICRALMAAAPHGLIGSSSDIYALSTSISYQCYRVTGTNIKRKPRCQIKKPFQKCWFSLLAQFSKHCSFLAPIRFVLTKPAGAFFLL